MVIKAVIQTLSDENGNYNHHTVDKNCEQHFILLSLLDALLPDVVLKTCLSGISGVSKVNDVLNEASIDVLQAHGLHFSHAIEGLTHAQG